MFKQIDLKDNSILDSLAIAPIYKKVVLVRARASVVGEQIETVLADDKVETKNTAHAGDWVIINPSGEEYILSEDQFLKEYEVTDTKGTYQSKGYCRAYKNPFHQPIEIMASWGSAQTGDQDCFIACACDATGNSEGEPYLIENKVFLETYVVV